MSRKILLIEPNYKNKYPPIGLMKISTYHKMLGDDVIYFKGECKDFIKEEYYFNAIDSLYQRNDKIEWVKYKENIINYFSLGRKNDFNILINLDNSVFDIMKTVRYDFKNKLYLKNPKFDRLYITTLFTFYWDKTIETINQFKLLCKNIDEVKIGGIAASLIPNKVREETGIMPHIGLLNVPGIYDDNQYIIDELPLDYSILLEIDYQYVDKSAYYGYMTRGCINKCKFCAVPKLEPVYNNYICLINNINYVNEKFGKQRNLLLLDNNVFASNEFNRIIDEIKLAGFDKETKFCKENQYNIAYKGLLTGYNNRGFKKRLLSLYYELMSVLDREKLVEEKKQIYILLKNNNLLYYETMQMKNIINIHDQVLPYFTAIYKPTQLMRYVDFNQGIDARLVNDNNMKKLSEICIRPLRIAFDDWKLRPIYEKAVRTAVKYEIKNLSNYLLYNYTDTPLELYLRMRLNVELCEELKANIYSFPMKYLPIEDPRYFMNRNYIGKHWNRKFIRAIQAVLNSTKGKIGKGLSFFNEAFGQNECEFEKILYMPEAFIIYRMQFKKNGMVQKWWTEFTLLNKEQSEIAKRIIESNDFTKYMDEISDKKIISLLSYYLISRDDATKMKI